MHKTLTAKHKHQSISTLSVLSKLLIYSSYKHAIDSHEFKYGHKPFSQIKKMRYIRSTSNGAAY
jgi:hypothetical protein